MAEITGIGGIFLKFDRPKEMREWYTSVLGMPANDYGVMFEFNHPSAKGTGQLQLGTFESSSGYFGDPSQQVMINFRVDDLETFEKELRSKNVEIVDSIETYDYGKFLHINDPEGNRIELWEPINSGFSDSDEPKVVMR